MMIRLNIVALCCLALSAPALGDYILTPSSGGASEAIVYPGDAFELDLVLTSDAADEHVSAIFRVQFSRSGLVYQSSTWRAPYSTGSIDDQSSPGAVGPALPLSIDEAALSGVGYPGGAVDIELSNLTDSGVFAEGTLVTLGLLVPVDALGAVVTISAIPDTFDNGMAGVATIAGDDFTLTIVPEPFTAYLLALGGAALIRRRRLS